MSVGILGTKLGMTQLFDKEEGIAIPVTVIQAGPCKVTQIKTKATDGYTAIQLGYQEVPERKINQPEKGHLAKAAQEEEPLLLRHLCEYRLPEVDTYQLGQQIGVDIFSEGQLVDAIGTSIGRGFAGYQKRHNFRRGPMSHGSKNHRLPGSTGAGTTPGRIYPGKRMAGRKGGARVTIKKLSVVRIDTEHNLLVIKGSVPGKPGTLLNIVPAKKVGRKG